MSSIIHQLIIFKRDPCTVELSLVNLWIWTFVLETDDSKTRTSTSNLNISKYYVAISFLRLILPCSAVVVIMRYRFTSCSCINPTCECWIIMSWAIYNSNISYSLVEIFSPSYIPFNIFHTSRMPLSMFDSWSRSTLIFLMSEVSCVGHIPFEWDFPLPLSPYWMMFPFVVVRIDRLSELLSIDL